MHWHVNDATLKNALGEREIGNDMWVDPQKATDYVLFFFWSDQAIVKKKCSSSDAIGKNLLTEYTT